jgi:hypothetical protein
MDFLLHLCPMRYVYRIDNCQPVGQIGGSMKDLLLKHPDLWSMLQNESEAQIEKWGIQDHSPFKWLAFTMEELGELSAAISDHWFRHGLQSSVVKEAIQTATLCLKIAEMYLEV